MEIKTITDDMNTGKMKPVIDNPPLYIILQMYRAPPYNHYSRE